MLVIDASVLVHALIGHDTQGSMFRDRLRGQALVAPELIDLDVLSVLRRLVLAGDVDLARAGLALADLRDLPMSRVSHLRLIDRIWDLRQNLTSYDAAYVALAEQLNVTLVTADVRLSRAPGLRCDVEVLG